MTLTLPDFITRWQASTRNERGAAQGHFLDRSVLDAYGWPHDITDEQTLERLLALNLERAASAPVTPLRMEHI